MGKIWLEGALCCIVVAIHLGAAPIDNLRLCGDEAIQMTTEDQDARATIAYEWDQSDIYWRRNKYLCGATIEPGNSWWPPDLDYLLRTAR